MKNLCKNVLKWCFILMCVGFLCNISAGITFILLAVLLYRWAVKGISFKSSLQSGVNLAQKGVDKLKE